MIYNWYLSDTKENKFAFSICIDLGIFLNTASTISGLWYVCFLLEAPSFYPHIFKESKKYDILLVQCICQIIL